MSTPGPTGSRGSNWATQRFRQRRPVGPQRRRRELQPRAIVGIAIAWVFLWDRVSIGNILSGLLVGVVVTLAFPLPSIDFVGRLHPYRVLVLVATFVRDLVLASVHVSRLALSGRIPVNAVVGVQLRSRSDFYLTLTSELVGLVPGSVVIEARRHNSMIYIHMLDVRSPEDIEDFRTEVYAVEERVVRAFGSPAEIASLEALKAESQETR